MTRALTRAVSGAVNLAALAPYLFQGERHYERIAAAIDQDAVAAIIRRFADTPGFHDGRKYLRLGLYLRDSVARAVALGLHRPPTLRLLDLGSGAGYFLLACRHFGHEVLGFDLPANDFYRAMLLHFGLNRVEGTIRPFETVEGLEGRFDLITAYAVTFAKYRRPEGTVEWGEAEWLYFFADLRGYLRRGSRLVLRLNLLHVRGLRDKVGYGFLRKPIPGFQARILNRREICLTAN